MRRPVASVFILWLFALCIALGARESHALMQCPPGPLQQCHAKAKKAVADCQAAAASAEAAKAASSGTASQAASGNGMSKNGHGLGGVTNGGAAADRQCAATCTQAKQSGCDQPCDAVTCAKDKPDAQQTKASCDQQLDREIAARNASAANNDQDAKKSDDSGNQAQAPPMPPPPSPTPPPTPDPAPPSSQTPALPPVADQPKAPTTPALPAADCGSENAYLFDQCSDQLMKSCMGKFKASPVCESFTSRYCKPASGSQGASGSGSSGALKSGAGISSDYCNALNGVAANDFCAGAANNPEIKKCPSCSHDSLPVGSKLPDVCGTDPAFANPDVARAINSGGGSSGGGGGGGGGGGAISGAGAALAMTDKSAAKKADESIYKVGASMGVDSGGGGGGGAGLSGSSDSLSARYDELFKKNQTTAAKRAVALAGAGLQVSSATTDVAKLSGPNVFMISSQILQGRCRSGRLLHCTPQAK